MKKILSVCTFILSSLYGIACYSMPHLIQIDVSQLTVDSQIDLKPFIKDWFIGLGCKNNRTGKITNQNGFVGLALNDMQDMDSNHFVRNLCSPDEEDQIPVISGPNGHTVILSTPESCHIDLNKVSESSANPYSITTAKLSGVVTIRNNEPTIENLSCDLTYEK